MRDANNNSTGNETMNATIAEVNYKDAIDQQEEYSSLRESFDSYLGNAGDSATEQGADWDETCSIFCKLVNDNHPELNY